MSLMERLGYVRLTRYGLVKTPDGRIASLHDGRVVGWTDEAGPPQGESEPPPILQPTFVPNFPPVETGAMKASEGDTNDDEWEWVIAIARARAAAEQAVEEVLEISESDFTDASMPLPAFTLPAVEIAPRRTAVLCDAVMTMPAIAAETVNLPVIDTPSGRTRAMSPQTLLPVPKLPRVDSPRSLSPVVSPRRFPAGTGRHPRGS